MCHGGVPFGFHFLPTSAPKKIAVLFTVLGCLLDLVAESAAMVRDAPCGRSSP
jgi:hypothetical protein